MTTTPPDSQSPDDQAVQKTPHTVDIPIPTLIRELLERGVHVSAIRRVLRQARIRWSYSYSSYQDGHRVSQPDGNREKQRRQRQLSLCENGCGAKVTNWPRWCEDCLRKKWGM